MASSTFLHDLLVSESDIWEEKYCLVQQSAKKVVQADNILMQAPKTSSFIEKIRLSYRLQVLLSKI